MITLRADAAYGYGGKQFIARITGRHPKFTFAYEFVGKKFGKRNEGCEADVDEPGLYITREIDRKGRDDDTFYILMEYGGELRKSIRLSKEFAMPVAKRLGAGERIERIVEFTARPSKQDPAVTVYDPEIITARQAEQAEVARTIDAAVEACWAILAPLPEREAKKALAQLKLRVTPPKPAPAVGLVPETPVGVVSDANQDAGASDESVGMTPTPVQEGAPGAP